MFVEGQTRSVERLRARGANKVDKWEDKPTLGYSCKLLKHLVLQNTDGEIARW